jgi:hypothetical protein
MNFDTLSKYQKLGLSLLFDTIGFITFIDIIWAPLSAYFMTKMYKGRTGKIAGIISFIEEIIPGLDIIPSFTLMWLFTYVFKTTEVKEAEVIDIS